MKLAAWKYFSVIMALVLVLGTGVTALVPAAPAQATSCTVTGISPNSGKAGDLISATITGTGFTGATRVRIKDGGSNDIVYAYTGGFTIDSDTQISISFTIPAGATPGPGDVRVYVSGSWYYLSSGFTVLGPYIDDVTPSSGKRGETFPVVIEGGGFTGASAVTFSSTGITATIVPPVTDTEITANVTIADDATLGDSDISVTTTEGTGTDTNAFEVFYGANPNWVIKTKVPNSDADDCSLGSLVMDSEGHPHIAYAYNNEDSDEGGIRYATLDGDGELMVETVVSFTVNYTTQYPPLIPSIALYGGDKPCIAYLDQTAGSSGSVMYAWRTDAGWQTPVIVDSIGMSTYGVSLAVNASDIPCIAYFDYSTTLVKYTTGNANPPTSWTPPETANLDGPSGGKGCSLVLDVDGFPHISYVNGSSGPVYHVWKNAGGWQTPEQTNANRAMEQTSIALQGTITGIACYDWDQGVTYASSTSHAAWAAETVAVDSSGGNVVLHYGAATNPRLFYYMQTNPGVRYSTYSGSAWSTQVVDGGNFGSTVAMDLDSSGVPHVAYIGNDDNVLYYAYYAPSDAPTVTSVTPSTGAQGDINLEVVIGGTNFTNPSTVAFSGTGITVNSVTFGSTTQLTANVTISEAAATTARNVTVTTSVGSASKTGGFTVTSGGSSPQITGFTIPNQVGETIINQTDYTIALTMPYPTNVTALVPTITTSEGTTVDPASGVAQDFTNPVTYTVSNSSGARTITTADSISGQAYIVTVTVAPASAPTITSVIPNSGMWGETLAITITGTNFTGATSVSFGSGITVTFTVVSPTQINTTITISMGADTGARNVTVTTPQGSETRSFTVNANPSLLTGTQSHGGGGGSGSSGGGSGPGNQGMTAVSMPNIVVQSATVSATKVAPGETVTITANLANKGTVNATSAVKVYVNGQEEAVQGVTVNSGSNRPVSFTLSRNEPGTYTVYVGGTEAGSFTVEQAVDPNMILLVSTTLFLAGLVLGAIYIRRRQNY